MQTLDQPNPDELAKRLFAAAEEVVQRRGLHFCEGADQELLYRAEQGALEIITTTEGDLTGAEGRLLIDTAERSFAQVAEAMVEARPQVYSETQLAENMVGEQTLERALEKFCPLWPICS